MRIDFESDLRLGYVHPTVIHKPLSTQNSTSAQDTGSNSFLFNTTSAEKPATFDSLTMGLLS